ncbi:MULTISPECIES: tetratricopeptide repeat protein [unclassified Lysinibacillus]|uniref:tetratricopeptide repeat protein n=1 Tax=unclassified Lysinibacillus TaxID=2636778 RepID=UPI000B7D4FB6|nr:MULTISPECIES: tetratricopeptide repeat protein [unclassified Lysinibacillus]
MALKKENELAVESFNQALEIKNDEKVHYNLGVLYMFTKSYQYAIDSYQTCLELNPTNASAHLNLGVCLFSTMSYEKSIIHYNKAKEIEPNLYQAYGQIGEHYRFFSEYEKAVEYFERCLLLDSRNYQALYGIAFSLIKLNRVSEAAIYYKLFINQYRKKLFKNKLTANIAIVDIGYETTTLFSISLKPNEIASVKIGDFELQVNLHEGKSYIFIGAPLISDNTGSMSYATLGKIYTVKKEFQHTVAKLKEKADLFQYFDQPLYVDFNNNISVNVIERNKNILIEININDLPFITGITDEKTGCLESFIEQFNKNGQFRLHLETKGEAFIVDGLKNVNINLLQSEK